MFPSIFFFILLSLLSLWVKPQHVFLWESLRLCKYILLLGCEASQLHETQAAHVSRVGIKLSKVTGSDWSGFLSQQTGDGSSRQWPTSFWQEMHPSRRCIHLWQGHLLWVLSGLGKAILVRNLKYCKTTDSRIYSNTIAQIFPDMIIAPALRFCLHYVESPPHCSLGHWNDRRTEFGLTSLVHLGGREPSWAQ